MEIIDVSGYTLEEKVQIGTQHLLPKHLNASGLAPASLKVPVATIQAVVEQYTNESGVRGLDKRLAKLVRHRAKQIALEEDHEVSVDVEHLHDILGIAREKDKYEGNDVAGVVTGLAWTPRGGDILFIESSLTPGKGKLTLTGNLGAVMKESADRAQHLKARRLVGLTPDVFDKWDVTSTCPRAPFPRMAQAQHHHAHRVGQRLHRKVRKYLAMSRTTLRGQVLPVGGIKEKILAAKRAGIKEIILCERNRKDVDDINPRYIKGLSFTYVTQMREVVDRALLGQQVDNPLRVVAS